MSEEESGDKPHEATPEKVKEARKKGQIAKSNDLTTAGAYSGFWLALSTVGAFCAIKIGIHLQDLLANSVVFSSDFISSGGMAAAARLMAQAGGLALPFLLFPAIGAIVILFAQRAIVFTPSNLAPKGSRINPLSTAKQKFGRTGLFEFAKSVVKLLILSVALGVFLSRNTARILETALLEPRQGIATMLSMLVGLVFIAVLIGGIMGGVDWFWQKAEFARRNRMSQKELRDEVKNSEGDPEFKGKRRQKGQEIALSQMLVEVPKADVVIVNPTHFAVALKWDRASTGAPVCVAKGVDEAAAAIRKTAEENHVPLHSDPPTARALHAAMDIGDAIPAEHYAAVAAAIRFADDLRRKARQR